MFADPAHGDYRVKDGSPALKLGFENFPMDQFGVRRPELKAIAKTPELPSLMGSSGTLAALPSRIRWKGAVMRNLAGDEYSALGVSRDAGGVVVAEAPAGSEAAKAGLRSNDFIQSIEGHPVRNAADFVAWLATIQPGSTATLDVVRNQKREAIVVQPGATR